MKKVLLLFAGLFSSYLAIGQLNIANEGTEDVMCGTDVTLTDSNAESGNYSAGEDFMITLCPDGGNFVNFNTGISGGVFFWDVAEGDFLTVYDGDAEAVGNGTAPVLGVFGSDQNGMGFSVTSTITNGSGCLTLVFMSGAGSPGATGFEGAVICATGELPFEVSMESTPLDVDGYIDICQGETVMFSAITDFPFSGNGYDQTNETSNFSWSFGNEGFQEGIGMTEASYTFDDQEGYLIQLLVTDVEGHTQVAELKVRVSTTPIFSNMIAQFNDTICLGDMSTIIGGISQDTTTTFGVNATQGSFQVEGSFETYLELPDGGAADTISPEYYSSTIPFGNFQAGSVLDDLSLIESICVTIHHTYVGDLEMWVVCPSGDTLLLFDAYDAQGQGVGLFPGGWNGAGTDLGNPQELEGFEYCFTPDGAITFENTTDSPVPPGDYYPMADYTNLIGCPLNGDWELFVGDYYLFDEGAIAEWSITFNDSIVPDQEFYTPTLVDYFWEEDETIVFENDTLIDVEPIQTGPNEYVFHVIDDFDCEYDTTIVLEVLPQPVINGLSPGCQLTSELTVANSNYGGFWSSEGPTEETPTPFLPTGSGEVMVFEPGDYVLTFDDIFCQTQHEVNIYFPPTPIALIDPDTLYYCIGFPEVMSAAGQEFDLPVNHVWSLDSLGFQPVQGFGNTLEVDQAGIYTLTVTDEICDLEAVDQAIAIPEICEIETFNVFSPNGDGVNDFFYIEAIDKFRDPIVYVYNRWGNLVFEKENYRNNWNMNGLSEGTYFYVIQNPQKNETFKGYFTLTR